ncbi:MAG: nicotinamide riboside transporter PnuC [Bacteroidota bacterium]
MNTIFEWIFGQYSDTPTRLIVLEFIGVCFGLMSVIFSKRDNILVFPAGIISTSIFAYILMIYGLLGDTIINIYYFIMSILGWYAWTRKVDGQNYVPIISWGKREKIRSTIIFFGSIIFVALVYEFFDKWDSWVSYVDILTTAIFFVAMWLMAKKYIENWIFLIIGDVISVPLYFYKGLIFSSILNIIFTIIAIYAYQSWKKNLYKPKDSLLK